MGTPPQRLLLAITGLEIDGGIACVNRAVLHALAGELEHGRIERVDRVLLYDRTGSSVDGPGEERLSRGSQARFVYQTWRLLRRFRHDLVLFDLIGLARAVSLPLPGFRNCRYAVFVHGLELVTVRPGTRTRAVLEADRLLVNSEHTASLVARRFGEESPPVHVTPLCIDPERVKHWEDRSRGRTGAEDREPAVLIVGRMVAEEPGKGHQQLLEAWPRVRAQVPEAELWVAGAGNDVTRLQAKAQALGVGDAVRFLGRVPDDELSDLYRRAAVFAMPSRQEGFGLVYAEALWHGLPCIGSHADAAGQVIRDGETGYLVPYGDVAALTDAILRLLRDPMLAARLGSLGARDARERFTFPSFRERLLAALGLVEPRPAQISAAR